MKPRLSCLLLSMLIAACDGGSDPGQSAGGKADDHEDACNGAEVDADGFCRADDGRFAPADCCIDDDRCQTAAPDDDGICRRADNGQFAPAICCEALCNDAVLDEHGICRSEDGRFAKAACCNDECADPGRDPAPSCGDDGDLGRFCGGFAGLPCPDGFTCVLDGDFPDAGGHCEAASV